MPKVPMMILYWIGSQEKSFLNSALRKSSRDVILIFFDENEKSILDERVCGICSGSGC